MRVPAVASIRFLHWPLLVLVGALACGSFEKESPVLHDSGAGADIAGSGALADAAATDSASGVEGGGVDQGSTGTEGGQADVGPGTDGPQAALDMLEGPLPETDAGADVAPCTPACSLGNRRCGIGGGVEECVLVNACPAWGAEVPCASPKTCKIEGSTAQCTLTCSNVCAVGARRCGIGGGVEECVTKDGCPAWGSEMACASPRKCETEGSGAVCKCPLPPAACGNAPGKFCASSTSVSTCAVVGAECLAVTGTKECDSGQTCDGVAPRAECVLVDKSAPKVVAVTPGPTGATKNAKVVITFSEPMNKLATQTAYQSADIPASAAVLTWNDTGTTLTVSPNAPLEYAWGDNVGAPAKQYKFMITNTATDLAGNALATYNYSFTTLRRIYLSLKGVPGMDGYVRADGSTTACTKDGRSEHLVCTGDGSLLANAQYKGFFTFDIGPLPDGIVEFESADLRAFQHFMLGNPYALGNMNLEHLTYSVRDLSAFNAAPLRGLGVFSNNGTLEYKSASVVTALRDDYPNRSARSNRSQYRTSFDLVSNFDAMADNAFMYSSTSTESPPTIETTFLVP